MFGKFKGKVGIAYKIIEDFESAKYLLCLYKVVLDEGQYVFIKYKEVKSFSFESLYNLIEEIGAKPTDYYAGQDFGKKLRKIKN